MSGGGGQPDHTTTTTELPAWAQPYAQDLLTRGAALSNQPMPVYGGQRTPDLNGYQQGYANMVRNRASNGSPEINAGSQNIQDTLNGSYLDSGNPYLSKAVDNASQDLTRNYMGATNNTDAMMARSGAFGGSAWQQAQEGNQRQLANGLSQVASNMNYQNYGDERARQMSALGMAPTYGNQAYIDAQQVLGAGQQQFTHDQQLFTDDMNQWNEQQQSPYKQLDVLGNTIHGAVGGGGTTSQTAPGANPWAQGIGGAAAMYGLLK